MPARIWAPNFVPPITASIVIKGVVFGFHINLSRTRASGNLFSRAGIIVNFHSARGIITNPLSTCHTSVNEKARNASA